jgi:peptidoglycan/LPS O-acetylase OafA/YrhL
LKEDSFLINYRKEIDGLRAIAVISVILHHANFIFSGENWFAGGFIGVDIFFVISGYLITKIILTELNKTQSFDFYNFYERRARRILPMLLTVILVSIPFASQILFHTNLIEYSKSLLSAIFFSSNFFFYFVTTEYAAESSLLKPFLHTWSLGIEEQFYIIFPILLFLVFKFLKSYLLILILLMIVLSIQFSEIIGSKNAELNFYLPTSRFWELLVGSLIAYLEISGKIIKNRLTGLFPFLGIFLIIIAITFFNFKTPHPGYLSLIPIVGTALIICYSSSKDFVGGLLGSSIFVRTGLISYSAYLWHFPIFAFIRLTDSSVTNLEKLIYIALIFILSTFSYRYIEQPFRNRNKILSKYFWLLIAICITVISAFCIFTINSPGNEKPLSRLLDRGSYTNDNLYFETNYDYSVKDNNSKKNILIVGNSHAEDLLEVLSYSKSVKDEFNITLTSPIKRDGDYNYQISCFYDFLQTSSTYCDESEKNNYEFTENLTRQYEWAKYIILASNWLPKDINNIGQLKDIINKIKLDGKIPIIALPTIEFEQVENGDTDIEVFVKKNKRYPNASELNHLEKLAYRDLKNNQMDKITWHLQNLSKEMKFKVLDKKDFQCNMKSKKCFILNNNGYRIIYDHAHYSKEGAIFYAKIVDKIKWFSID